MVFLDSIKQLEPLKAVRKVRSLYSKTGSPALFASVTLLWVTTIPQKLGNLLKHVMQKTLQKVLPVPLTGLIKFFGLVQGGVQKVLLSLRNMLKAVSPKGNVYKAVKGTEAVEIIENNRDE